MLCFSRLAFNFKQAVVVKVESIGQSVVWPSRIGCRHAEDDLQSFSRVLRDNRGFVDCRTHVADVDRQGARIVFAILVSRDRRNRIGSRTVEYMRD